MNSIGDDGAVPSSRRRHDLSPRKRLGQNFLRDRSFLPRILEAAEITGDDTVVEIGAGTGVLTTALLARAGSLLAIELDDNLYRLLREEFAAEPRLRLWHGNALNFDPQAHVAGPYKLVGNIPYYITGPLLRRFLEIPHGPSVLVFMVQREVADRIVARPGNSSLLAVSVQFYADASVVARVPAGAFYPVPKVDSAILKLVPRSTPGMPETGDFFRVVKAGFSMPRKQLANSLGGGLALDRATADHLLHSADIDGKRRAETLSVDEWVRLTRATQQAGFFMGG